MVQILAVYVRVSSKSQNVASQIPDLKAWVARHIDVIRGDVEVRWFKDTFTGKSMDRPQWTKLQKLIDDGRVAKVVVWRLDRLGRTASGLTKLFDQLVKEKVGLVSIKDGVDLDTPAGRMMAGVLASVAQFETEIRQERSLAGLAIARENGVKLGRPEGKHTRIKVTPEQAQQVKRLKAEGMKIAPIARATGLSRPTIYSILAE